MTNILIFPIPATSDKVSPPFSFSPVLNPQIPKRGNILMGKKTTNTEKAEDPRLEERWRLKNLAFSKGLLCRNPVSNLQSSSLAPSKTVVKHQGTDVVKKGQRKNRFLFSFSGFLAPMAGGGKIGELSDLATGNPILYLDFPQVKIVGL